MIQQPRHIKVLFLEDNPDDVELELYELRKGGFTVVHEVARNRQEFLDGLSHLEADIIIADYSLPDITGIEAIQICQERCIDAPVILITGAGNETIAVDSLRQGATDYLLKKNIEGFAARVTRAMQIWAEHKAKERAEEEKQRLQQQLFQTQKLESIGRLAGGIAHDFNNFLTGIMGYASMSIRGLPTDSPHHRNLQLILDISKRASELIRQLLLFSRKIPLELKTVDLNQFFEETVRLIKLLVEETVEVRLVLQEDIPKIKSDKGQLTQLLINLAVNARDAMKGKGVLTIKTETVTIDDPIWAFPDEGDSTSYVCVSVSDTGCGIPDKDMPRIFDPFFTTKDVGQGTGLGLAIVHSITNAHNGWIDVISEQGKGTTFQIYLPIHLDSAQYPFGPQPLHSTRNGAVHFSPGNETILVVEDEDFLRLFFDDMLRSLGYRVLTAKDGDEAIKVYQDAPQKIDLVVSDMSMPKKSGLELFQELRAINPTQKFILITGYNLEDVDQDVLFRMNAVLNKPYTTEKIAALIRRVLTRG